MAGSASKEEFDQNMMPVQAHATPRSGLKALVLG